MIFLVESFLCPDKQGTLEKGQRIESPKRYFSTNNNKDEDNSSKNLKENSRIGPGQQDIWRNSYRRWFPKLQWRQSSGGCRFNPDCGRITIQGYLTLEPVTESEQTTFVDSIKYVVR